MPENQLEEDISRKIRVVDGTIVREPGKTRSQWRILYSIRLPRLVCDFFALTATIGEGSGESLNRLPVGSARTYSRGCRLLLNRWD
jgi:hypothetical protein